MSVLDARIETLGPDGAKRSISLRDFHLLPETTPHIETVLLPGELITAVVLPPPPAGGQLYRKVRDRASYEFALTSAAVVLVIADGVIRDGRVGLGGVATVPWRATAAERVLGGAPATMATFHAAAEAALEGAIARHHNAFKVELAKRTLVRQLAILAGARDVQR
jgi:xanthine dehydrogenase YagS FAD-binding subunit